MKPGDYNNITVGVVWARSGTGDPYASVELLKDADDKAQALFDKGAIGPKTLLKMLDFPDPDDAAADGVLYKMDPMAYMQLNFPDFAQKLQMAQQQQLMQQASNNTSAGMNPDGTMPEQLTEPAQDINRDPASAALSQVPIPDIQQGMPVS